MPESDSDQESGPGWSVEPQESGFVAFWPHQEPPSQAEFVAAVTSWVGSEVQVDQIESDDDSVWTVGLQVPGVDSGFVIWCERSRDLTERDREQIGHQAASCPWVIRVQTILSSEEPGSDYFMTVGLICGSMPDIVAVLDVVTGELHTRSRIDREFLAEGSEPVERVLWRLSRYEPLPDSDAQGVLLGTCGLSRCGLPEIELMEVPHDLAEAGAVLLHTLAGLMLENSPPDPGQTVEIGDDLVVSLQPVAEVQQFVKEGAAGSAVWRARAVEHGLTEFSLPRAAVCSSAPEGAFKSIWRWPKEAVERIAEGRAVLYMTQQSVRAAERRARATWSVFAMAFASLSKSSDTAIQELASHAFLIQAPVPGSGNPRVEQSWFQVRKIDHAALVVAVIDSPVTRKDLAPGMTLDFAADAVSDWRVELGQEVFEPNDADDLLAAVDRVRESGGPLTEPQS